MEKFITPSEVIEYIYCPRFLYYMNVLNVEQHEYDRLLVNKGREIHDTKLVVNKDYIRKRIGCIDKEVDVYLSSEKLSLVGKVDEVLFFADGTASPLDYKYAFWDDQVYKTLKYQQTLYSLLIEELYQCSVNKAFLVYVRSKNKLIDIEISEEMKRNALSIVKEMFDIINRNFFPEATGVSNRCGDCTYRNLCFF